MADPVLGLAWRGLNKYRRTMTDAAANFKSVVWKNVERASEEVVRSAQKDHFKGNRTKAKLKGLAVTSPDGVLGIMTGTLRRSLTYDVNVAGVRTIRANIGPANVPYGRIHEFGGKAGRGRKVTIPKRPYVGPAIKDTEDTVFELLGLSFKVLDP